jgi:O-antigen/teichoic acid export membrane protein|tara:strand:+ start:7819 stop:9261 length:1443 start_codon:yes stop_codon:yes gene_type:complete
MKQLAGQTAIYGLSSILGRMINFLLVPLQTAVLTQSEYGINVDFYSLIAFLIVIVTFGMETSYFRFSEQKGLDERKVFGASVTMISLAVLAIALFAYLFQQPILAALRYQDAPQYLFYLVAILALDALSAIPFARLRRQNKAFRFAGIKLVLIFSNVAINLYFFLPSYWELHEITGWWSHEMRGVDYIFIANFWASLIMFGLLVPTLRPLKLNLEPKYTKVLLRFGIPLLIGGLAGIANEMLDRQLLKYLLPKESWAQGVGIYGAVYKISIFLILFNQAFRYAAEPFFFKNAKNADGKEKMAKVMVGFTWVMSIAFVMIISGLDYLKYFIDEKFWVGLELVPILLLANVILGINTNLNVWYKVSDKTSYGIYITFIGLAFTVVGNVLLIPIIGIFGAAWTTLAAYSAMFVASLLWSLKHYPVPYNWGKLGAFVASATLMSFIIHYGGVGGSGVKLSLGLAYLISMFALERNGLFKFALRS